MRSNKPNALAALADRMFEGIDGKEIMFPYREDVEKAIGIIRVLSQIGDTSLIPQECFGCGVLRAISTCRAIAGEGGENGK